MGKARLIIGVVCMAVLIWMFLYGELGENHAPVLLIIGISLIAIAKQKIIVATAWI